LTGLSFALLYSLLALPIARLADRNNRVWLVGIALGIWSLMTAASGFAIGMITLTVCRMGVAFGEAGCVPASHSLISGMCVQYFTAQPNVSLLAGYLTAALLSCFLAPLVASAQLLVPANLRAH
jgi:MFS family permease